MLTTFAKICLVSFCLFESESSGSQVQPACQGYDYFMCGNVCLDYRKTCKCSSDDSKQSSNDPEQQFKFNWNSPKICCLSTGNCTKDKDGKFKIDFDS